MKILIPRPRVAWVVLAAVFTLVKSVYAEEKEPISSHSLAEFVEKIVLNHPDTLAAKAEVLSAKSILSASNRAIYNPVIKIGYEDSDVKTKSIGISQTIDWSDLRGSRQAKADAELQRVLANYDMKLQSLMARILQAVGQAETGRALTNLSKKSLQLMLDFKQIAERRFSAGDLNQVELNLARLSYSQMQMDFSRSLSNKIEAEEKLRALIGMQPTTLPALPEKLHEPELPIELDAFLRQLPSIRAQVALLAVARKQVSVKQSETAWNPTVAITTGSVTDNRSGVKDSLIGFNLSVPLYVRNDFKSVVDATYQKFIAQEQQAHLAYRVTRAKLITATERYRNLLSAWNNWHEQGRKSAAQQLRLNQQLWQAGEISAATYSVQVKQALETVVTGYELRNQLWQSAFKWMAMTASLDNWLGLNFEQMEDEK